jgi:CopG family nickel-responsive transcriptional regulator
MVTKMGLKRFGVSIPEDLLKQFDGVVDRIGYVGRSEAIRDAMRLFIVKHQLESEDALGFASLNIVYEHKPRLMATLVKYQHDSNVEVISTLHTHISHTHCFEILTMRGSLEGIQKMADKIGGLKGIEYIELFSFAMPDIEMNHHHEHTN